MAAVEDGARKSVSSDDLSNLMAKKLEKKGTLRHITAEELALHNTKTDGWIAYQGKVYDITKHIEELEQSAMGKTSTLLVGQPRSLHQQTFTTPCTHHTNDLLPTLPKAIFRVLGTDCTEEMIAVHSETALKQLQGYMIGVLQT